MYRLFQDPLLAIFVLIPVGALAFLFAPDATIYVLFAALALWISIRCVYNVGLQYPYLRGQVATAEFASPLARVLAFLADGVVFAVPTMIVFAILRDDSTADAVSSVITLSAAVILWRHTGATPGKWAVPILIVDAKTGERPSYFQAVVRLIGYGVSVLPLGLGLLWALWDERGQAWHDKMAGTIVIYPQGRELLASVHDEAQARNSGRISARRTVPRSNKGLAVGQQRASFGRRSG